MPQGAYKQAMTRAKATPFNQAVGQRLRALREQAGVRQDDVAASARHRGFRWSQATVAAIELGRRELSSPELVVLPVVLYGVGIRVELADLLPEEGSIEVAATPLAEGVPLKHTIEAGTLRQILGGRARDAIRKSYRTAIDTIARVAPEELASEVKAAARLGMTPRELTQAAMRLWGRSLSEERERRLAEQGDTKHLDRRSLQARRGHVTRALLVELETGADA